jgi:hypothetical protein
VQSETVSKIAHDVVSVAETEDDTHITEREDPDGDSELRGVGVSVPTSSKHKK